MNYDDPRRCEAVKDELTELALGMLTGRQRAEVLSHVGSCATCGAELERLSITADTLLQLAPEVEPPLGFETRLAERLGTVSSRRSTSHLRRVSALGLAAVAAIVVGFGLGDLATNHNPSPPLTASLTSAILYSHGHDLGQVMVSAGQPAWMFMTVDDTTWSGKVWCTVQLASGKVETIGVFTLSGRYAAWGAPLRSAAGQVRSAQLVAGDGTVIASAQLRA